MTDLLDRPATTATTTTSPLERRFVESRLTTAEEAEQEAVEIFQGSTSKAKLLAIFVVLLMFFTIGQGGLGATALKHKLAGAGIILACVVGMAFVIYEFYRKHRVYVFEDSFAVARRFRSQLERFNWTDVARFYCLDRTTETVIYLWFIPIGSKKHHQGRLRIVLADGRQVVIGNSLCRFSEMAEEFTRKLRVAQLVPYSTFVMDGGTLDFEKFGFTGEGLEFKGGKLLGWNDIERVSVNRQGRILFKTGKFWRSPRFTSDSIPNAALLLDMLALFGVQYYYEA